MASVKVALLQTDVAENVKENLATGKRLVSKTSSDGARMVALPEMFCRPWE